MADNTAIEWADATLNYVNGCTRISPGCGQGGQGGCYAERLAGTRLKHHASRIGLTKETPAGPRWTGAVREHEPALMQALRWRRGRRIFWNAHGDLGHEAVPDSWIFRQIAACALTPQHTHMILTKRSDRMRQFMNDFLDQPEGFGRALGQVCKAAGFDREVGHRVIETMSWPLPNVWLGVSAESQEWWDERVEDLRHTPAAIRFVSGEPLLGPIDGRDLMPFVDWLIIGAESGPNARGMANEWADALVQQGRAAGTAVFVKQLSGGGPKAIKDLDTFPPGLRFREMPRG